MEILRIPSQYHQQIKWFSPEDCEYILKTIFSLANGEIKEVENSMRGGFVLSMFREAVQMENRALSKKGEKWQEIEVATSGATSGSDIGCTQEKKSQGKSRKEKEDKRKNFTPPTIEEVKEYFSENGYKEDAGEKAWNYYNSGEWIDSKGNKVKSWKQKCQSVWFKEENKKKSLPPEFSKEKMLEWKEKGMNAFCEYLKKNGYNDEKQLMEWFYLARELYNPQWRENIVEVPNYTWFMWYAEEVKDRGFTFS